MKSYSIVKITGKTPDLHKSIRIAIGHILVSDKDIQDSYLGKPNVTKRRKRIISRLLNEVFKYGIDNYDKRVDLLVLPEVSIPHSWAPFIVRWAREHQIGIVCGLEHRVDVRGNAWNELLAALPYRGKNGARACVPVRRLKRHYSPHEQFVLEGNFLKVPNNTVKSRYQLFQWRGASFAIYNCFELACIEDRSIFKSKVDFIICSEFNSDVNYFSNIVESAARDLHCYVAQVNSAQFGDSRIVSPSRTDLLNPMRIKGGDNQTFLTMELPLSDLRAHQRISYGLQHTSKIYKPTPPGFDRNAAIDRIKLGEV